MNIAIISFTPEGSGLAGRIAENLREEGSDVTEAVKCAGIPESYKGTVREWTGQMFQSQDAIIYVGAAGIAVRSIAPYVRSKKEDPAVIVIDEKGKYCIPVLSGHIGGANELALLISDRIQALPVITTATDLNGKWAVDVFAAKNKLYIMDMKKAKEISAAVLQGSSIAIMIERDGELREDSIPSELEVSWLGRPEQDNVSPESEDSRKKEDIHIGIHRYRNLDNPSECPLYLVPKALVLGIGCKKGTKAEIIEEAVRRVFDREALSYQSICKVASIDLKAKEPGLLEYCSKYDLPFEVYGKDELMEVPGTFTSSEFVEKITGVDNICERSAMRAGGDRLIVRKKSYEGVTVAVAVKKWGCLL